MRERVFRIIISTCLIVLLCAFFGCRGKKSDQQQVVAYTSLDKVFSEPILKAFEKGAGL